MLSSLIRSTLVAATLLGSFGAATAAPREAAGVTLIDHRGERHHGRDRWDDRGPRHGDRWDHRGPRRGDRWDRAPRHGGGCSARLAVNKARDFGVRRAQVVRFDRRAVVVSGIKRGYPIAIRFAQARGCPVVGSR